MVEKEDLDNSYTLSPDFNKNEYGTTQFKSPHIFFCINSIQYWILDSNSQNVELYLNTLSQS